MTETTGRPRRRRGLSDRQIASLPKKRQRYTVSDPELRGHYVRVPPQGPATFVTVTRDPYGKQIWTTIGNTSLLKIEEAREKAREIIRRVKAGQPAVEPPPIQPNSFKDVAENWLRRSVIPKKLRTQREIERRLRVYVFPHWETRAFTSIRRSDVAALLDHVQDNHGARQADTVLADLRTISNWFASRDDAYVPPFVRGGMRRTSSTARARILDDAELRTIWKTAEANGTYGGIIRFALLTAQRRAKILTIKWDDLNGDTWTIATEEREKGNPGTLRLPQLAVDIIRAQPKLVGNPYVFGSTRGNRYSTGTGASKAAFDAKLPPMLNWTLHDLRRTARSLMSRAGVQSEHAERVLAHVIGGVEGIYDRHDYRDEKAEALRRLANLIESIVNPPADNVVQLPPRAAVQP